MHYYGPQKRVLYVAHTDTGLVGLGEYHTAQPELVQRYIGTNPFDWLGDVTSLGLGTAMYDLMGQAAGVAAAMCVEHDLLPRDVPVGQLRGILRQQGAVV